MTEAFEIGVSLALQDGVSEAIGKARRDVAALEHAVRESGVSLRSLRDVGVRSASVAFGEPRKDVVAGPAKQSVQEAAPAEADVAPGLATDRTLVPPMEHSPRMDAEVLPRLEMMAPRVDVEPEPFAERDPAPRVEMDAAPRLLAKQGKAEASAREAAPLQRTEQAQEVIAPVQAVSTRGAEPIVQAIAETPASAPAHADLGFTKTPARTAPERAQAPLERLQTAVAPVGERAAGINPAAGAGMQGMGGVAAAAAPGKVLEAEPQTRLGTLQLPAGPASASPTRNATAWNAPPLEDAAARRGDDGQEARGHITLLSALRLSGGSAAMTQSDDPSAAFANDMSSFGNDAGIENTQSGSPAATARAAPPMGAAPASASGDSAPSQGNGHQAGPREGDVFLDGMLVGRWMSKFLNHEAGRASVGPTGFDARRGRLLPGVTVGA